MSEKKKIILFTVLLFLLSYAFYGFMWIRGINLNSEYFDSCLTIIMYFPTLITIGMVIFTREGFKKLGLKIKFKKTHYLLYGVFIPVIITGLLIFLQEYLGIGNTENFGLENGKIVINGISTIFGSGPQTIPIFILNVILTSIPAAVIGCLWTFGEELGWRGYLQDKLVKEFGVVRGLLIMGVIWGYWHMPIIFMGYNYPETPIIGGLVLMPLFTICLSILFGWLRIASKSVWPAVLAHSSINMFFGILACEGIALKVNRTIQDIFIITIFLAFSSITLYFINKKYNSKVKALN